MNEEGRENFKFFFKGGNKTVSISVGDYQDLNIVFESDNSNVGYILIVIM